MKPLLSIIMPHYNHGKYVGDAVGAILQQSFQDFELILVDDASTDGSIDTLYTLASKNSKIRLFRNASNQGPAYSGNKALQEARGELCVFASADDWVLPGFFERSIQQLESHPTAALCTSDFGYFQDGEEIVRSKKLYSKVGHATAFNEAQALELFQTSKFQIPGHTTVMRKQVIERLGGFRPELGFLCDWFLLHSAALHFGFVYVPDVLAAMRMHPNAYSAKAQKKKNEVYNSLFKHLASEKELRSRFLDSTLLQPMIKSLLPKIILDPRRWELLLPRAQNKLLKKK